jgi:hypothetical protein
MSIDFIVKFRLQRIENFYRSPQGRFRTDTREVAQDASAANSENYLLCEKGCAYLEKMWHAQPCDETNFTLAFEGYQTSQGWVGEAVPSGFDVARKPVIESGIASHRHDQVIPAEEFAQRRLTCECSSGLEMPRD